MDLRSLLDARPVVVALAGSNGAGKSTFFHSHLVDAGLRFVNADDLAVEFDLVDFAGELGAGGRRAVLPRVRDVQVLLAGILRTWTAGHADGPRVTHAVDVHLPVQVVV